MWVSMCMCIHVLWAIGIVALEVFGDRRLSTCADHLEKGRCLDLERRGVVLEQALGARVDLLSSEHPHLLEHGFVLGRGEFLSSFD